MLQESKYRSIDAYTSSLPLRNLVYDGDDWNKLPKG